MDFLEEGEYVKRRESMVNEQILVRGIKEPRLIEAMRTIPRHLFVPAGYRRYAYSDHPLPIGEGQTISQPYMVALMTNLLQLKGTEKVLEIGTGSGYQAAILSRLAAEVHTVEILPEVADKARQTLDSLGFQRITITWVMAPSDGQQKRLTMPSWSLPRPKKRPGPILSS